MELKYSIFLSVEKRGEEVHMGELKHIYVLYIFDLYLCLENVTFFPSDKNPSVPVEFRQVFISSSG